MTYTIRFQKVVSRLLLGVGMVAMAMLIMGTPASARADTLYRQLQVGSRGSDVSSLQTFLARDPSMYPQGLVTGYFGFLTKSAVSNFQSRNGIPAVGRVGPMTLPIINAQMAGSPSGDVAAAVISNVVVNTNRNAATVNWTTNESAHGLVYYSNVPLVTNEHPTTVDISGSTALTDIGSHTSQSVVIPNLQANTVYYYMVYTTDESGNISVTWPSTFRTTN